MQYLCDENLTNFKFWSGGKDRADMLTYEQLNQLDSALPELFGEKTPTDTEINDLFWFDFGTVCNLIGLHYDEEHDKILENEDDEGEGEGEDDLTESVGKLDKFIAMMESASPKYRNDIHAVREILKK